MPAFSGLWDGIHGEAYSAMPKADANPPQSRGIVRTFMQRQSMHGHVNALGRNSPATIAQTPADRADVDVIGGMEAWPSRNPDAANQVTITNLGDELVGGTGTALESRARPADPAAADLAHTYDTTKNEGYPKDDADHGQTAEALAEDIET